MESLANKYRPQRYSDVISQGSTVKILEQLVDTNSISNCYLFCGPSGVGKTTLARIFAMNINHGEGTPIEIDGASNSGVENVRNIIEEASELSLDSYYKVYIIDECQALSNAAWQAFLKCLEQPPERTIFMFCTTDPQKVPVATQNRVMKFNLTRVPTKEIYNRLLTISYAEGFTNVEEACDYISKISDGSMRTAIANLEKCARYSTDLSIGNVIETLGLVSYETLFHTFDSIVDGNESEIINMIENIYSSGYDLNIYLNQLFELALDLDKFLLYDDLSTTSIPESYREYVNYSVSFDGASKKTHYIMNALLNIKFSIKKITSIKSVVTVALIKLARGE